MIAQSNFHTAHADPVDIGPNTLKTMGSSGAILHNGAGYQNVRAPMGTPDITPPGATTLVVKRARHLTSPLLTALLMARSGG